MITPLKIFVTIDCHLSFDYYLFFTH